MLKRILNLLIVLMLMLATAGSAVAVGDDMHMEDDVGSGEGDPGGGNWNPADNPADPELYPVLSETRSTPLFPCYWIFACIDPNNSVFCRQLDKAPIATYTIKHLGDEYGRR